MTNTDYQPVLTAEIRAWIGREGPEETAEVTRREIERYAHAVGNLSPLFLDEAVASLSPFGGLVAPFQFYSIPFIDPLPHAGLKEDGIAAAGALVAVEPWSTFGPAEAAARLHGRPHLAWLDSALSHPSRGRWSVVASDPRWVLTARSGTVVLASGGRHTLLRSGPLDALVQALAGEPLAETPPGGLPFAGGAIGYMGFELARSIERLPATTLDDVGAHDLALAWYDAALVWDGGSGSGWLVGRPEAVRELGRRLLAPTVASRQPNDAPCLAGPLRSNFTRRDYLAAVQQARRYIAAGDIYQVNLSQRFSAPVQAQGFDLYRRLRAVSPAPFAAYFDAGDGVEVLSSSPERLLEVDGLSLETRPIKGTRPRGAGSEDDARQAAALLASTKDRAEHVMIVDLERSDLGRIAEVGSVCVTELAALESFAQVHHLTSTVVARRRADVDTGALLRAVFPGGSVTGAPKIRALEIIDELEPTVRGVYTGAMGYFSAHGRIDLNVAIRTITLANGTAHLHVGGAIVHDSEPEAEYIETLDKARGMALAIGARLPDEITT